MDNIHDKDHGTIVPTPMGDLPLHLLDKASDPIYYPDDPTQSCFFVTTFEDFQKLSSAEKRRIYLHRHIVITDVPLDGPMKFDSETLEMIVDLDKPVPLQCE